MKRKRVNVVDFTDSLNVVHDTVITNLNVVGKPKIFPITTTVSVNVSICEDNIEVKGICIDADKNCVFCDNYEEDVNQHDTESLLTTDLVFKTPITLDHLRHISEALNQIIDNIEQKRQKLKILSENS
jgi:hypothetical protein